MDIKQSLVLPVGSSWVMDGSLGRFLSIHFDAASEMSTYDYALGPSKSLYWILLLFLCLQMCAGLGQAWLKHEVSLVSYLARWVKPEFEPKCLRVRAVPALLVLSQTGLLI